MNAGIIATRYAQALLEYTDREGVSGEVYREMESLAHSFAAEPRLRAFLMNPMLADKEKEALLKSAVGQQVTPQTQRFLKLVAHNNRVELLQSIAVDYLDAYRRSRNILMAYIETAVPIPEETRQRIRKLLGEQTKAEIWLDLHVNPEIIGGFIFRLDFREVDASVAGQLKGIKKQFKNEIRQLA